MSYTIFPQFPSSFYLRRILYKCTECGNRFYFYDSKDEFVFFETDENEFAVLPIYGKYGYLDLIERLTIPLEMHKTAMIMLEEKVYPFISRSPKGMKYRIRVSSKPICSDCRSNNYHVMEDGPVHNPDIAKISFDSDIFVLEGR